MSSSCSTAVEYRCGHCGDVIAERRHVCPRLDVGTRVRVRHRGGERELATISAVMGRESEAASYQIDFDACRCRLSGVAASCLEVVA
jgi:hypothetical protein